jgi:hypothetical protein
VEEEEQGKQWRRRNKESSGVGGTRKAVMEEEEQGKQRRRRNKESSGGGETRKAAEEEEQGKQREGEQGKQWRRKNKESSGGGIQKRGEEPTFYRCKATRANRHSLFKCQSRSIIVRLLKRCK